MSKATVTHNDTPKAKGKKGKDFGEIGPPKKGNGEKVAAKEVPPFEYEPGLVPLMNVIVEKDLNSRTKVSAESQFELKESIRTIGLLQPLGVQPAGKDQYRLVYGFRRHAALKELYPDGEIYVPVRIMKQKDRETALLANLAENASRADIDPWDAGLRLAQLKAAGVSVDDLAAKTGYSTSHVNNLIRITTVDPEVGKALAQLGPKLKLEATLRLAAWPKNQQRAVWNSSVETHSPIPHYDAETRGPKVKRGKESVPNEDPMASTYRAWISVVEEKAIEGEFDAAKAEGVKMALEWALGEREFPYPAEARTAVAEIEDEDETLEPKE